MKPINATLVISTNGNFESQDYHNDRIILRFQTADDKEHSVFIDSVYDSVGWVLEYYPDLPVYVTHGMGKGVNPEYLNLNFVDEREKKWLRPYDKDYGRKNKK